MKLEISQEHWTEKVKKNMMNEGWILIAEDEDFLEFIITLRNSTWERMYDKQTRM